MRSRRIQMPVTPAGLEKYDSVPPAEAARLAWTVPGVRPGAHSAAKQIVREVMPLLARALDRTASTPVQVADVNGRLWLVDPSKVRTFAATSDGIMDLRLVTGEKIKLRLPHGELVRALSDFAGRKD